MKKVNKLKNILTVLAIGLMAGLGASGSAIAASGKLVVYTTQANIDAQKTVDAFNELHPDVEVEWIRDGTTKLMARLRAEIVAGAPRPDILHVADVVTMQGMKRDGFLQAYPGAPVGPYDESLYDPDRFYFGTKIVSTGLVYHKDAPMKLTSWNDLLTPEAKGRIAMPSPLYSGAALIHLSTIVQHPDLGWDYYERLAANGARAVGGNGGTLKAIASGEKLYGMVIDYMPIRAQIEGSPVVFVIPSEGVSVITDPVAIMATAKNPEAAQAYVDFLLSLEGQQLSSDLGLMPVHPEVAPPAGFPELDSIKIITLDATEALENAEEYKERFAEIFGG